MQVLDSDASTASGGCPPESSTTVFHLRHQLSEAQKKVDVLRLVNHRLEVEMTTAEARCQMPEFWLVSCLTPLCAHEYGKMLPFLGLLILSRKYMSLKVHHLQKVSQVHITGPHTAA